MNPTTLSLLLLLSVLLVSTSDSANDPPVKRCVPGHCGNITNITYPFWVFGQQSSYCGFPQFTLYCDDDILSLNTPSGDYYDVHDISYANHSISVAPRSLKPGCPVYRNLTFSPDSFTVSPTNMYLLLLYYCQGPQIPAYDQVPCAGYKIFTFLRNYTASESIEFFEACETVEIPVSGFPGAKASNYDRLVKDGFLLEWIAADCSDCTASGGQCGFNVDRATFMCICNDLTHSRHCLDATWSNVKKIVIGVAIGGGILVMCFICCIWYCRRSFICCIWYCRRRIMRQPPSSLKFLTQTGSCNVDQEMCSNNYHTHLFSYAELHEATNGFDESRELGDGGFGTAYKGQLRDGRVVTVKRLYENNYKRS